MRKDDILLNEAYRKVHTPQTENVDEAFNVTKARLAGVGGAIKGLKNRVVGGLQSGVGSMAAKAAGVDPSQAPTYQAGQAKVQAGKDASKNAKVDSILKNQTQDINKFASKLTNQLVKLGLGNTATVSDIAGGMTDKLKEILKKEAPASNQLNAGSPTPAPAAAPTPAPASSATPTPAASTPAPASAPEPADAAEEVAANFRSLDNNQAANTNASATPNPNQPPVQQTSTASQAAAAMKSDDAGSSTETEAQPEAQPEAPSAAEAPEQAAPTGEVPPDNAPQNVASQEEIENAQPEPEDPKPKINKSTHTAAKSGKVYAWRKVKSKDGNWGQAWKNIETGEIPTKGAQEAITAGWVRAQKKVLAQQAEQPAQQNESFKSFFWKV